MCCYHARRSRYGRRRRRDGSRRRGEYDDWSSRREGKRWLVGGSGEKIARPTGSSHPTVPWVASRARRYSSLCSTFSRLAISLSFSLVVSLLPFFPVFLPSVRVLGTRSRRVMMFAGWQFREHSRARWTTTTTTVIILLLYTYLWRAPRRSFLREKRMLSFSASRDRCEVTSFYGAESENRVRCYDATQIYVVRDLRYILTDEARIITMMY